MRHAAITRFERATAVGAAALIAALLPACERAPSPTAAAPSASDTTEPSPAAVPDTPSFEPQPYEPAFVDATGEHEHTNRLINETSPYLLQHAHNPVNWYPWGEEAFVAARREDKPIFLSIGYSTCYWCHVMERESFEDDSTARYMNENFICIKIDREERPDVDTIYMTAVQAMTGRGGWPLNIFLEPTGLRPLYGGTYFPKHGNARRKSFRQVMTDVHLQWTGQRNLLISQADRFAEQVRVGLATATQPVSVGPRELSVGLMSFKNGYDPRHGGFRPTAPKFPAPTNVAFMVGAGWDQEDVRQMVTHTLDRMAQGGMYDQIGGGFHRYSTDAKWLVPHFEKMLYDNAQLASLYADVHERTGDAYYAQIVRETLDYVIREMTGPDGRLYSAQDAESGEREGASYVWTGGELRNALDDAGLLEDRDFAMRVYGVSAGPNFKDPHHPREGEKNVLFLAERPDVLARQQMMDDEAFREKMQKIDAALLSARNAREQPITDDKTVTAWNGLMITGFADGGRVLDEPRYVEAGRRAAAFILANMRTPDGGLYRTYRDGTAKIDGLLVDYAFLAQGLLALHRAGGDDALVHTAIEIMDAARARFWDDENGGYFDTLARRSDLFVRTRTFRDSVIPSGNSIMLHNLLDLYERTGDPRFLRDATPAMGAVSRRIAQRATSTSLSMLALKRFLDRYPGYLPRQGAPPPPAPVTISASTDRVTVPSGATAQVELTITVGAGFHLNAHEPGIADLTGLAIAVTGSGLDVEVDYPEGEAFTGPLGEDILRAHTGRVTIPVTIRRTGAVTGTPELAVSYQVCTDRLCLVPATSIVDLEIVAE